MQQQVQVGQPVEIRRVYRTPDGGTSELWLQAVVCTPATHDGSIGVQLAGHQREFVRRENWRKP